MYRFLDSLPRPVLNIMQRSAATDGGLTATPTNYTSSACLQLGLTRHSVADGKKVPQHVPINWYWPPSNSAGSSFALFSALISHVPYARDYAFALFVIKQFNLAGIIRLDCRLAVFQYTRGIDYATSLPTEMPDTCISSITTTPSGLGYQFW